MIRTLSPFENENLLMLKRAEIEKAYEWTKWAREIPFISFDPKWEVRIVPPYLGAVVRYLIRHKNKPDNIVSVYLDCYNLLGGVPNGPYWEVLARFKEDASPLRVDINDVTELLQAISDSLEETEQ